MSTSRLLLLLLLMVLLLLRRRRPFLHPSRTPLLTILNTHSLSLCAEQ
jgi:hypothetical protein